MVFQFYFKKMFSSEALKSLSQRKVADAIQRFIGDAGLVRITFSTEKNQNKVHCYFQGWNGIVLNASSTHENMYAAIDIVTQKLEAQLSRQKMRTRRRSRMLQPLGMKVVGGSDNFPTATDWEFEDAIRGGEERFQLLN